MKRFGIVVLVLIAGGTGLALLGRSSPEHASPEPFRDPTDASPPPSAAPVRESLPRAEQGPAPPTRPTVGAAPSNRPDEPTTMPAEPDGVRGQVIDLHGDGVARALVVLENETQALRTVRTDAGGHFSLRASGQGTHVWVHHPSGWAREPVQGTGATIVRLRPGRSIAGIVQTSEGVAVPLAPVVWWIGDILSGAEQADIHGRFEVSGLPPSEPTALAVAGAQSSVEASTVVVPPGETSATLRVPRPDTDRVLEDDDP